MPTAVKTKRIKEEPAIAIQTVRVSQIAEASAIERVYKAAKIVTDDALALKVVDYPSSDMANIIAKRVNAGRKAVDEVRKRVLAEPERFTKTVNAMFKPIFAMCDDALDYLDQERRNFRAVEAAKKAETEAKAAAEEARRHKISIAQGGTGENIKPVTQPVDMQKVRSTDTVRRIPDKAAIQAAIDKATEKIKVKCPLEIPGVSIFVRWDFEIIDSKAVPDEYRKDSFID